MNYRPVVLVVLDGWAMGKHRNGNAIALASVPHFKEFWHHYPHTLLAASGEAVGLPAGQMGNSEVGHLNLGAGRVVYQELTRITRAIRQGDFFQNPAFRKAIDQVKKSGGSIHLMGLLSDGGVHSHLDHLFALLQLCKEQGLPRVYVHGFLDGRDVPPQSAETYIRAVEDKMRELGVGVLASVSGRYYAMDRDKRWDRTKMAYDALVYGQGEKAENALQALEQSYAADKTDEFVVPTVILKNGKPAAVVEERDAVIFFNFRPDRARQLTRAFTERDFAGFDRGPNPVFPYFVTMTQYAEDIRNVDVAFRPEEIKNTLGEVVSRAGLTQLRLAETEKYAHVTYFFNGGEEKPFPLEERQLIASPKVATYDQKPEMSAYEIASYAVEALLKKRPDFAVINFANPDMVGHTGNLPATIKAVETVDGCLGQLVKAVQQLGGAMIITADHGNAEEMIDQETGTPQTAHTTNPVPFILITPRGNELKLRAGGALCDVAPTALQLLGLPKPEEMTGKSLIVSLQG